MPSSFVDLMNRSTTAMLPYLPTAPNTDAPPNPLAKAAGRA